MLLKCLIILSAYLYVLTFCLSAKSNDKANKEDNENLSDINSVSNFIKEFHRKLEKDLYPISDDYSTNDNDFSLPNVTELVNQTDGNEKNITSLVNCSKSRKPGSLSVEMVNSKRLMQILVPDPNVTHRLMEAECVVLLFYSKTCPFSCLAAPHFNALPRAFPSIKMVAVNAVLYQSFNTQYGIAGVPTIMLFHNGKAVAKFNDSEYTLKMFARFVVRFTGLKPVEKMFVTSGDFGGPVPSRLTKDRDYMLGLAWLVIILAVGVGISKSTGWRDIVENIQATWREAQAQHDHND